MKLLFRIEGKIKFSERQTLNTSILKHFYKNCKRNSLREKEKTIRRKKQYYLDSRDITLLTKCT